MASCLQNEIPGHTGRWSGIFYVSQVFPRALIPSGIEAFLDILFVIFIFLPVYRNMYALRSSRTRRVIWHWQNTFNVLLNISCFWSYLCAVPGETHKYGASSPWNVIYLSWKYCTRVLWHRELCKREVAAVHLICSAIYVLLLPLPPTFAI